MNHSCIQIIEDERDYTVFKGQIPYEVVNPSGSWLEYIDFHDRQKQGGYETDSCVLMAASESFDEQMNQQIESGKIPASAVRQFADWGFMETSPIDNGQRFHSSPRFLHVMAGTKHNGTPLQKAPDTIRQYGMVPYRDLPFDAAMTDAEYFAPLPDWMMKKAADFLALIGGKDAIQYHWVVNGNKKGTPITALKKALLQAPLCFGIAVSTVDWNQVNVPTSDDITPEHGVCGTGMDTVNRILDSYAPFQKNLPLTYAIPYALQTIFKYIPPPPTPPTLPPNPTKEQALSWLDAVKQWLLNLLLKLKGRQTFTSITVMPNKPWYQSKTLWFNVLTIVTAAATYFGFTPDQELSNNVTSFLVAMSPVINIGLRLITKQPINTPANK